MAELSRFYGWSRAEVDAMTVGEFGLLQAYMWQWLGVNDEGS